MKRPGCTSRRSEPASQREPRGGAARWAGSFPAGGRGAGSAILDSGPLCPVRPGVLLPHDPESATHTGSPTKPGESPAVPPGAVPQDPGTDGGLEDTGAEARETWRRSSATAQPRSSHGEGGRHVPGGISSSTNSADGGKKKEPESRVLSM